MDEGTRYLILSLGGGSYALPISHLVEITARRDIQRDANRTGIVEGKIEYRGKLITVINLSKLFKLPDGPGGALVVIRNANGILGLLADAVTEIVNTEQRTVPLPKGIMSSSVPYYSGVLRYQNGIVLALNVDELSQ
jgi:purine-binding chemotaxis protein CheW